MARRALVEILADASGFVAGLRRSSHATEAFSADLKKLSVNARASAEAQVAASVKKTARIKSEAAAYREIAAAAGRGSREQIAASNLAAAADARLARSMGVTAHEANTLRSSAVGVERDVGRATRGALAGSGIFRGLGRSLAFASGGFLAFASAGQFLRKSLDAAETTEKAFRSLSAQAKATGTDVGKAQADIGNLSASGANLGFNKADLEQGFTVLLRGSGSAKKAISEMAAAEDVARAKGMSLSQGALIVNRALISSGNSARALGIHFPKAASQAEKLAIILQRFAGQAAANTTETDRFNATLFNTETIIGNGVLPVLNKYLAAGSAWLTQMNQSGRLQKDVATAAHDVGVAVHIGVDAFKAAETVIRGVDDVTGSFEHTLKDLAAAWLVLKARMAINWAVTALGITSTGTAAAAATTEAAGLAGALGRLGSLGPIVIPIVLEQILQTKKGKQTLGTDASALQSFTNDLFHGDITKGKDWKKFGRDFGNLLIGPKIPSTDVKGKSLNPFAPNPFGSGDLGLGALKDPRPVAKAFAAAAKAAPRRSPLGQFNLLELKRADAERTNNTKLQRSILASEETIVLRLRDQAKTLKKRTEFALQAASIEDQIRSIDQQATSADKKKASKAAAAAKKAAEAAKKAALGGVPLPLQLAQAKADALAAATAGTDLTKSQIAAREAIRAAEYKAIRSHKLSMQGLIDAWTEIGSINGELSSVTGLPKTYHAVSTRALTAGLGLARGARAQLEERLAQSAAHRGTAPNGPAALGQQVGGLTITGPITITGVRNIDELYTELQKVGKRRHQRRGQR